MTFTIITTEKQDALLRRAATTFNDQHRRRHALTAEAFLRRHLNNWLVAMELAEALDEQMPAIEDQEELLAILAQRRRR